MAVVGNVSSRGARSGYRTRSSSKYSSRNRGLHGGSAGPSGMQERGSTRAGEVVAERVEINMYSYLREKAVRIAVARNRLHKCSMVRCFV